jgi:type IV secretory pathway VirB2 component (pilin)
MSNNALHTIVYSAVLAVIVVVVGVLLFFNKLDVQSGIGLISLILGHFLGTNQVGIPSKSASSTTVTPQP